jgi:predicted permease
LRKKKKGHFYDKLLNNTSLNKNMDWEFIIEIFVAIIGFAFFFWLLTKIFIRDSKKFRLWLVKNKYFHIISISLVLILTLLNPDVYSDFILLEFLIFLPILILTYYFVVFIGFIIYWRIKQKNEKTRRN